MAQSGEKWGILCLLENIDTQLMIREDLLFQARFVLNSLPFTKKDARAFTRFMASGAITLDFDKQGRVNIPNYLSDYASLGKDVVIIGVSNRIEIWSDKAWDNFIDTNIDSLSDIAENLFDANYEL